MTNPVATTVSSNQSVYVDDMPITITLPSHQMSLVFGLLQTGPFNLVADIVQAFGAQFHVQLEAYQQALKERATVEQAVAEAATGATH